MGRPSKLTESEWEEIKRRASAGESTRALAREFHVAHSTISERCSKKVERIKSAANKVFDANKALAALPVSDRPLALTIADNMKATLNSLMRAARAGADSAALINEFAHERAQALRAKKADKEGHQVDAAAVDDFNRLSFAANRAMSPAVRLVIANRDQQPVPGEGDGDDIDYTLLTDEELELADQLADKVRGHLA